MDTLEKETSVRNLNIAHRLSIAMLLPDSLLICGVHSCRSDLDEYISHKSEDSVSDSIERNARVGRLNGAGILNTLYWVT